MFLQSFIEEQENDNKKQMKLQEQKHS